MGPRPTGMARPATAARPEIKEAYWNSWLQEQGQADEATVVVRSHAYDVNFDLAAYNYGQRPGSSPGGIPVDPGFLKVLNDTEVAKLRIVVKPFVLGRGLSFQLGQAATQPADITLDLLRTPPTGFTRDEPLPSFADKVKALRVTIGVDADGTGAPPSACRSGTPPRIDRSTTSCGRSRSPRPTAPGRRRTAGPGSPRT